MSEREHSGGLWRAGSGVYRLRDRPGVQPDDGSLHQPERRRRLQPSELSRLLRGDQLPGRRLESGVWDQRRHLPGVHGLAVL